MANIEHIKQEVRKLSKYGVHITGLTPAGTKAMPKIVFNILRHKFGLWSCLVILFKLGTEWDFAFLFLIMYGGAD